MPPVQTPVAGPAARATAGRAQRALLALLLVLPFTAAAQSDPPPELEHIEALVERGMDDWDIPGLALSVVRDDELVWARGFGVRRLGHPEPRSEEHTSELQSRPHLVCRLLLEKKKK